MTWVNQPTGNVNPLWDYRDGMKFIAVEPDKSRPLIILTGALDPTNTWKEPFGVWVHQFRGVTGGTATVICSRFHRACPFCYENEIFKLGNPNYKNLKQKQPYSPKFNALVQVYDVQYGCVAWALFTKTMIDGVNFLLTNFPQQFKNTIILSRIGKGLDTSYRVDNYPMEITQQIWDIIQQQIVPFDDTILNRLHLSDEEIKQKSGIDPAYYFAQKLQMGYNIDISQWGDVPQYRGQLPIPQPQAPMGMGTYPPPQAPMGNYPPVTGQPVGTPPPPVMSGNQTIPSMSQPPVQPVQSPTTPPPQMPQMNEGILQALEIPCSVGVYTGQKLGAIIKQTGKTYITYLLQASQNQTEKDSANLIIQNWDSVINYINTGALF